MIRPAAEALAADQLARRPLAIAALEGTRILADAIRPPGAGLSVGSNSGNDLVIPERFELTQYTLVTRGCRLDLAPPLYVQATVWLGAEAFEVQGFVRDLRKAIPDWPDSLPLGGERFVVRYATGVAFVGRFQPLSNVA